MNDRMRPQGEMRIFETVARVLFDHGLIVRWQGVHGYEVTRNRDPFGLGSGREMFSSLVGVVDRYRPIIRDSRLDGLYT